MITMTERKRNHNVWASRWVGKSLKCSEEGACFCAQAALARDKVYVQKLLKEDWSSAPKFVAMFFVVFGAKCKNSSI